MKKNKNNIVFTNKKSYKNLIFGNLSPKMSDPAFQTNNTLKQYVDKKLNDNITENITETDKQLFNHKKNIKKIKHMKSFHGIKKRNNRENNYTTTYNSKENLQLFSSLQNLSLSIINNKNKNIINDEKTLFKNMTNKKRDNANKIFSYTKINSKINNTNNKEINNKSSQKIKFHLSGKIPIIKAKNIFKKNNHSSSMKNLKIKNEENNINKTNIKEKKHYKTLFRFNSGDLNNNNLYSDRCISIKDNLQNNYLSLTQRINNNSLNKNKENKNNKCISNKNIKKMKKNTTNTKNINKKSKFQEKKNNKTLKYKRESKILNNNNDTFCSSELNKINSNNIDNNKNFINDKDLNNYYISSSEKSESNNNSSTYNLALNEQKILDAYELCWNLKNDYSKDIDISLISINNQKKSIIKNYKISPSNNDNNNINNIYLNNIQNVNNINNKQDDISNINNKEEYFSKLELLENENKMLKDEIKESKNRISILEYKIEELLDDKNSKENRECPQPTPYVVKYSKDIIPHKLKPKMEDNSQENINENLKEYSKNETKESEISNNRVINKNED